MFTRPVPKRMQQLLKENAFTENKFRSQCINYLNKMYKPRIKSVANAGITLKNALTENKFQSECINYLKKMFNRE
jgi:hypothetical protein